MWFSLLSVKTEAFGEWMRGPEELWPQVPSVPPTGMTKVNHPDVVQGNLSSSVTSLLQQGDVIGKVIVLMAQAAETAPLTYHEAEWQHEERADGSHDIGYGHEG